MIGKEMLKDLTEVVNQTTKGTSAYDTTAEVVRVEGSTAWVHIPGGVDETPVAMSVNAKAGDTVRVRVAGGQAWAVGNDTAPPTDDTEALRAAQAAAQAQQSANTAKTAADSAVVSAAAASEAATRAVADAAAASSAAATADSKATAAGTAAAAAQSAADAAQADATAAGTAASAAQSSADAAASAASAADTKATNAATAASNAATAASNAQTSANNAASAAATAGRAASVAQAAAEAAQGDIDDQQEWFWHDTNGSHVLGATSGYRNDIDSTGMKIVETATEETVAEFGINGVIIGTSGTGRMVIDEDGITGTGEDGVEYFSAVKSETSISVQKLDNQSLFIGSQDWADVIFDGINEAASGSYISARLQSPFGQMSTMFRKGTAATYDWDKVFIKYNGATKFSLMLRDSGNEFCLLTVMYSVIRPAPCYTFGTRKDGSTKGAYSFASGIKVIASGAYSHAEGYETTASGSESHAEGLYSDATGDGAHAEGATTDASGFYAHAEGSHTEASGVASHAEGSETTASGFYSHAQNQGTITAHNNQTAIGKYNDNQSDSAFEIGNGTSDTARSNAFTVDWDGNVNVALNQAPFSLTTDTTVDSTKTYYTYDSTTATYSVVANPVDADIATYYECTNDTDRELYAAITELGWESEVIA